MAAIFFSQDGGYTVFVYWKTEGVVKWFCKNICKILKMSIN